MVDAARVRALLDRLKEESEHLRRLSGLSPHQIESDPDSLAAIKYRFVVAIEASIDAGQHVISSEGLRPGADAADVFAVLGENDLIDTGSVESFQRMARFRNLLVHGYAQVDDRHVIEILKTQLDDLDSFRSQMAVLAKEEE